LVDYTCCGGAWLLIIQEQSRQRALERLKATKEKLAAAQSGSGSKPSTITDIKKRPLEQGESSSRNTSQHRDATKPLDRLEPAKKFKNYIEYDFSKLQDSRGGFMVEDDNAESEGMTLEEWKEKQKLLQPRKCFRPKLLITTD
jgi:DNA-repair protein complementing XP-A cells